MIAKLIFKKGKNAKGFPITLLTHIKITDEKGKYIKFHKHTDELLQYFMDGEIEVDDNLLEL